LGKLNIAKGLILLDYPEDYSFRHLSATTLAKQKVVSQHRGQITRTPEDSHQQATSSAHWQHQPAHLVGSL
jgi:hypothetical protein